MAKGVGDRIGRHAVAGPGRYELSSLAAALPGIAIMIQQLLPLRGEEVLVEPER
jgi:hypothetical protein